jgi:hypothetical protein
MNNDWMTLGAIYVIEHSFADDNFMRMHSLWTR